MNDLEFLGAANIITGSMLVEEKQEANFRVVQDNKDSTSHRRLGKRQEKDSD